MNAHQIFNAYNKLPSPVFILNINTYETIFQNEQARVDFSYSDEQLIGSSIFTLTDKQNSTELLQLINAIKEGLIDQRLLYLVHPHRGNLWSEVKASRTNFDTKEVCILLVSIRHGQSASPSIDPIEKQVLDNQADLVSRFLPDTTLLYVNDAYCKAFGKTREELLGTKYIQFLPAQEREAIVRGLKQFSPEKNQISRIVIAQAPNLNQNWYEWVDQAFFSETGELLYFQSTGRNISDRMEIEIMLRKSIIASEYNLDYSPDWFFRLDQKGTILELSDRFRARVFAINQECIGENIQNIFALKEARMFMNNLSKVLATKEMAIFEFSSEEGGQQFFFECQMLPLKQDEVFAIIRDIQKRKQVENQLAQSQHTVNSFVENAPLGILAVNEKGDYVLSNPASSKMFGYTKEEFLQLNIVDLVDDHSKSISLELFQQLKKNGNSVADLKLKRKDGSTFWCALNAIYIRDDLFAAFHIDISERVKIRQDLANEKALLSGLLNSIPDVVFYKDLQGRYLGGNPAFAQFIGKPLDEIIGKSNHGLFDKEHAEAFNERDRELIRLKESMVFEETVPNSEGHLVPLETLKAPFYSNKGELLGMLGLSRDIRERKKQEQILIFKTKFQQILMQLAGRMINLHSDEADTVINEMLAEIGEFFQVDRAYIFEYDMEAYTASNTFEWCAEGITPEIDNLQNTPLDYMSLWMQAHTKNQSLIIDDVLALPEGDGTREVLEPQGIITLIAVPYSINHELIGFIGFDAVREKKVWTESEMELLQFLAELLANFERRTRYEKHLFENEHLLRLATQASGTAIWDWDLSKGIITLSPVIRNILGNPEMELIIQADTYYKLVHPDDADMVHEKILRCADRITESFEAEYRMRHQQGGYVWVSDRGSVSEWDRNGQSIRLSGTITDITQRKNLELRLRESEQQFRLLAENMKDVVYLIRDGEHKISYMNHSFEKIFDRPAEGLYENFNVFFESIHPDDREKVSENLDEYYDSKDFIELNFRILTRSGEIRWILLRSSKVFDENGSHFARVGIASDISKTKEEAERLKNTLVLERQLSELKTVFIQKASHEFRTPLATIMATTESLKAYRDRMTSEEMDTRLDKIAGQVNHLKRNMEDLLSLTRLKDESKSFVPQASDIVGFTQNIANLLSTVPEFKHHIKTQMPKHPVVIDFDSNLMQRILSNAIDNAAKYSDPTNPILLTIEDQQEEIIIKVQDSGIGIPANEIHRLYEPFFRASNVTKQHGTGLGLPIIQEAVQLHGGQIDVQSEVNVGTTLTFIFPKKKIK